MNNTSAVKILLIVFLFFIGCAQPQGTLPQYNQQLSIEEQKIQNQLFADSWLKTYIDVSENGLNILFNAVDLCRDEDQIYGIGVDIATRYDGPESIRAELTKSLFLSDEITVVATGINTPARAAGFKKGDKIIKINNVSAPYGIDANSEFYKIIREAENKIHKFVINRDGQDLTIEVGSKKRCRFGFFVDLDNSTFNAFADGNYIALSLRMAKWLAQDEIGIALVFAHELAHNANRHIDDKKTNMQAGAGVGLLLDIFARTQGVQTDFMNMGANMGAMSYSIDYENEADYLSIYALALSGYDINDAANFWRRFAVEVPSSIYSKGGSHPSTSERFVRIEKTIKEVYAKINNGEKLLPN